MENCGESSIRFRGETKYMRWVYLVPALLTLGCETPISTPNGTHEGGSTTDTYRQAPDEINASDKDSGALESSADFTGVTLDGSDKPLMDSGSASDEDMRSGDTVTDAELPTESLTNNDSNAEASLDSSAGVPVDGDSTADMLDDSSALTDSDSNTDMPDDFGAGDDVDDFPCGRVSSTGNELVDLGHATAISQIFRRGDRILSYDILGHWVLWDLRSRTQITSGEGGRVDLVDALFSVPIDGQIEIRTTVDGSLVTTIPVDIIYDPQEESMDDYGLAQDGSYVWVTSSVDLSIWSTSTGLKITSRLGDYIFSSPFAGDNELRIARGPMGNNVIERIPLTNTGTDIGI